eukprot:2876592-Rhodomonas_salina.1
MSEPRMAQHARKLREELASRGMKMIGGEKSGTDLDLLDHDLLLDNLVHDLHLRHVDLAHHLARHLMMGDGASAPLIL